LQWPARISRIVNVELDPAVQTLSYLFDYEPSRYDVESQNLVIDGRSFLTVNNERFDLVFIDIYARQRSIPYHITTVEFFALAWDALKPGGVLVINVNQSDLQGPLIQGLARAMAQDRYTILSTPVPDSSNTIVWSRKGTVGPDLLKWRVPIPSQLRPALRHARRFTAVVDVHDSAPRFTDDFAPVEYLARSL